MIDLLPHNLRLVGIDIGAGPALYMTSLEHLLTTMQLNNAKHDDGKPEYDEVLQHIKDKLATYTWKNT